MTVIDKILRALSGQRFHLEDEKRTQLEIAAVLERAFPGYVDREVPVDGGIIDFVVTDIEPSPPPIRSMRCRHVGVEIKLKGQAAAHVRQLSRYAKEEGIDGLVLVTAKPVTMPAVIAGKPVACVSMAKAWL